MIGFPNSTTTQPTWARRRPTTVYATKGAAASAHPLVTTTALYTMRRGGNAVDAAVAAAMVAAVVMPEMCGLGGDLFALVHRPGTDETVAVLGSGISPRGATIDQMRAAGSDGGTKMPYRGPLATGVPGMVDAYFTLLERFGSRPFAELAEPAIGYAEDGFGLDYWLSATIAEVRDLLTEFPTSAATFLPGGEVPQEGSLLRQPNLARTLRAIAAGGADVFYRGDIGKQITDFLAANGGAMRLSDYADHKTVVEAPLSTDYRGYTVFQTGLPTQGLILLEALNIAAQADLAAMGIESAEAVHHLVEAKKLAYADRLGYAVDPDFGKTPMDTLLSPEWAKMRAASIDPRKAASDVPAGEHADGDTTYLTVVDSSGMMVSLIQSVSSAFGCGVVAGETGVVLNNRVGRGFSLVEGHPNIFEPGKKTMHTLNCFMIADPQGRMVVSGGTPGGDGQPQWNLQLVSALIDGGLDVQAAIELPRWTSFPGTDPINLPNEFELRVEDRMSPETIKGLRARGHDVRIVGGWDGGGSAQIVARDPETGILAAGTDLRDGGVAAGF